MYGIPTRHTDPHVTRHGRREGNVGRAEYHTTPFMITKRRSTDDPLLADERTVQMNKRTILRGQSCKSATTIYDTHTHTRVYRSVITASLPFTGEL